MITYLRIAILILVAALPAQQLFAMDQAVADSLTSSAREAYARGDHARALQLYDSVNTAYTSGGLLYNIANCYFKMNDVPRAILFYERALRYSPGDEDIKANLELARLQIVDRVSEMPRFSLERTLGGMISGMDTDGWARLSIWLSLFTFVLLAVAWSVRSTVPRRIIFSVAMIVAFGTLASVACAYMRYSMLHDDKAAIILAPRTDVRSEPREGSTTLFVLHKGTKVTILQDAGDWYEVSLRNGNVGWIPQGTLERISPLL